MTANTLAQFINWKKYEQFLIPELKGEKNVGELAMPLAKTGTFYLLTHIVQLSKRLFPDFVQLFVKDKELMIACVSLNPFHTIVTPKFSEEEIKTRVEINSDALRWIAKNWSENDMDKMFVADLATLELMKKLESGITVQTIAEGSIERVATNVLMIDWFNTRG